MPVSPVMITPLRVLNTESENQPWTGLPMMTPMPIRRSMLPVATGEIPITVIR